MAKVMKLRLVTSSPLGISPTYYNPDTHGVTQSVLSKFKSCRERCRLHLQGWTSKRIGLATIFGTVIHAVLEWTYTDIQERTLTSIPDAPYLKKRIMRAEKAWRKENPKASEDTLRDLETACLLAEVVLPVYFRFWHKDLTAIEWKRLEHQFVIPLSGTPTRGKMDGSFTLTKSKAGRSWLFETKTKSRLGEKGESNLVDVLGHELQVNLYIGALETIEKQTPDGVLYNIIRRPGQQLKAGETLSQFQRRVAEDVAKRPEYYFLRLRMSINAGDVARERKEHEAMVADYRAWLSGGPHYKNSDYCENKYGTCEFLGVCARKDYTGLYQRPTVFRELEDV